MKRHCPFGERQSKIKYLQTGKDLTIMSGLTYFVGKDK